MSRMTCGNWFVFVAAIGLGLMVTSARGGDLNPPAGPESTNSAMFTLNDIYNVLNTRTNVTKRAGPFTGPTAGPTNGTMHSLNDIMSMLTNRPPVTRTGQTNVYQTGDDGTYQKGGSWPNPRFSPVAETGAETNQIRDNLTGLIWARDASNACNLAVAQTNWATAIQSCTNLTYGGTNDWRLPNVRELQSLFDWQYNNPALSDGTGTNQWTAALGPFTGVKSGDYWSSTTMVDVTDYAYYADLYYGRVLYSTRGTTYYVWPVRGGQ